MPKYRFEFEPNASVRPLGYVQNYILLQREREREGLTFRLRIDMQGFALSKLFETRALKNLQIRATTGQSPRTDSISYAHLKASSFCVISTILHFIKLISYTYPYDTRVKTLSEVPIITLRLRRGGT